MPFDQSDAKWVVMNALKDVADFRSDNIEHFTFRRFRTYHKSVFLASLKLSIQQVVEGDRKYYDIMLNDDSIDQWATVGDCINWIVQNRKLRIGTTRRLTRPDLEV